MRGLPASARGRVNKLLTAAEAARRLGLSEGDVTELVERGELQALWIGGEVLRFHPDDLAAWRPRSKPAESSAPRGQASRGPVSTVEGPPTESSAPTSLGKGGLTTVSSQPVPSPATWGDRLLEFVYAYDGYVVTGLLVLTILVALFVAPHK